MPPRRAGVSHRIRRRRRTSMGWTGSIGRSNCCACEAASRVLGFWRRAMRRVISLYLPHWPSDRLRRTRREFAARDKPLVTAMMQGQRRILASVDDAAARLGLSVGMTVTHAQSLIPDLTVVECHARGRRGGAVSACALVHQIFAVGDARSAGWRVHRCRGLSASLSRRGRAAARPLPAARRRKASPPRPRSPTRRAAPGRWRAMATRRLSRRAAPPKRSRAFRSPRFGSQTRPSPRCTMSGSNAWRSSPPSRAPACACVSAAMSCCGSIKLLAAPRKRLPSLIPPMCRALN